MLTTTTPTGAQLVRRLFADTVIHYYAPYDLPGVVVRFLNRTNPALLVLIETELWPNWIHGCARRDIPVVLANARVSRHSFAGYRLVPALIADTLRRCAVVAVQTSVDAARMIELGAHQGSVIETGSMKFDVKLSPSIVQDAQSLRRELGSSRAVIIAASTHPGEEEIVLRAFVRIRQQLPHCLLVSVPRHPERTLGIARMCSQYGLDTHIRGSGEAYNPDTPVYLVDTIGELSLFYAACDLAFVGGSLVPIGGHNLLEPAALGVAMLTGPHIESFAEIGRLLRQAGAVSIVRDENELVEQATVLLNDAHARELAGEQGKKVVAANRGAVDRVMAALTPFMVSGSLILGETAS